MENKVIYKVFGVRRDGGLDLIASYESPEDAHACAMRYTNLFATIQIVKVSKSLDQFTSIST